jgi:hypothetical protein
LSYWLHTWLSFSQIGATHLDGVTGDLGVGWNVHPISGNLRHRRISYLIMTKNTLIRVFPETLIFTNLTELSTNTIMGKFLTGEELEKAITDIIYEAEKELLIVSPYIKLDDYFKDLFLKHEKNPNVRITLIFGKNEKSMKKSLSIEDLDFFKRFPNVSVVYVKNLHAKYYGNERKGVTTSINLYDYSFKHNIEFGVYRQSSFKDYISDNFDTEIYNFCHDLTEEYPAIYIKRPIFEKKIFGLGTNCIGSEVLWDQSTGFVNNKFDESKVVSDFEDKLSIESLKGGGKLSREEFESQQQQAASKSTSQGSTVKENILKTQEGTQVKTLTGYCIRTGVEIPFDPERPFCLEAFRSWNYWGDENFSEKYCHFSGEPSEGKTSKAKPILYKNWKKVKALM